MLPDVAWTNAAMSAADWIGSGAAFKTSRGHQVFYRREGTGPTLALLHGFPTWSYDYAQVAPDLARDYDVVVLDFLGYGASDKPRNHEFTVAEAADTVEELLRQLGIARASLVIHDYGGIVGQELLDRNRRNCLSFKVDGVHLMNSGVVYSAYRPTQSQKLLIMPMLGAVLAGLLTKTRIRQGLDGVRTVKFTDAEFDQLWVGMSRDRGHTLAHRLIRYNTERRRHHARWEDALAAFDGPLQLIWGMSDPVSGRHVLEAIRPRIPNARITALDDVGHFPPSEAPGAVVAAIRGAST